MNMDFLWKRWPEAEEFLLDQLRIFAGKNESIASWSEELKAATSTRLLDWVDHIVIGEEESTAGELTKAGFRGKEDTDDFSVYEHPGAQLPRVVLAAPSSAESIGIYVKVESIASCLSVHAAPGAIEGSPLSGYRRAGLFPHSGASLWIVERRSDRTVHPTHYPRTFADTYLRKLEEWMSRPRALDDENAAMKVNIRLAHDLVETLDRDMAAWIVLEGERHYWQSRNHAAQIQKARQDSFGMGWANHDHHTFRSSRAQFHKLVYFFEILGFHCREKFYAGDEAGWGAQVMENRNCGLVLFLDVDLGPGEVEGDFSHEPLPELPGLGTVGLWCALHGDSLLKGGMHHLEAQFQFDELTADLADRGVRMMKPFSDFPYLKQAFTEGEMWAVEPRRLERLLQEGAITQEQAEQFSSEGAVGSHLENLQRREGYKGFNQKNVSDIIQRTDPRKKRMTDG